MFNKDVIIKPFIFLDETNEVIEEKGNQFTALRKVQWLKEGEDPDKSKGKLEIRRWIVEKDGTEKANKGVVFMTEEGPHQLAQILVNSNYGKTKELMKSIIKRDDFKDSINNLYDDDKNDSDGDYFDMRDMLLSYSDDGESNDKDE
jgi:hypothetical protein